MSSMSSFTFPLPHHDVSRPAAPSPVKSAGPASYDSVWHSAVAFVALTILVVIVVYLISAM